MKEPFKNFSANCSAVCVKPVKKHSLKPNTLNLKLEYRGMGASIIFIGLGGVRDQTPNPKSVIYARTLNAKNPKPNKQQAKPKTTKPKTSKPKTLNPKP